MIKTEMIGNVCHTPETRTTPSGKTVCTFEVAVNEKRGGDTTTQYWRVSAWNKLCDVCQQFLTKGKKVWIAGKPSARAYIGKDQEAKYQLELRLDDIEFLSAGEPQGDAAQAAKGWEDVTGADLPF